MTIILRPGQRIHHIPGFGVQTSRRAVSGGNGLLNGLVAYWALDEAAGANNALDLHTNALTLTQTASPGSAAGLVYSGARTFNGTTQYFSRASETLLQTGDVDFTLASWCYLTAKTGEIVKPIASKELAGASGKREYLLYYDVTPDRLRISTWKATDSSVFLSANNFGSPPTTTWFLVIAWHDSFADTLNIQINNGTADTMATGGALQAANNATFSVGSRATNAFSEPWSGRIGPVAMWKSSAGNGGCLSAAQRTALYNGGAGLPYASFTV